MLLDSQGTIIPDKPDALWELAGETQAAISCRVGRCGPLELPQVVIGTEHIRQEWCRLTAHQLNVRKLVSNGVDVGKATKHRGHP